MKFYNTIRVTGLFLVLSLVAVNGIIADEKKSLSNEQREKINQRIEKIKVRLQLTEEQQKKVIPVLKEHRKARRAILKKYGINRKNSDQKPNLSFQQKLSLRKDLKNLQAKTKASLSTILSPKQMDEYDKIQEEWRKKLRKKFQDR